MYVLVLVLVLLGRVVNIPQHNIARHHVKPDWLSDSPRAARSAGKGARRGGSPYTDINGQPLLDGAGCVHDDTPEEGGWLFLAIGRGRRRALTPEERRTPYTEWPREKFVRLRRTRWRGLRYRSRVRPYLYAEMLQLHKDEGAIMCLEVKKPFPKRRIQAMGRVADRLGMPKFAMTLVHQTRKTPEPDARMAVAGEKLRAFHSEGWQTALLTHDFPPPPDLPAWRPFIDTYWGHNAEEYR